jgi:PAS domain S-box-containing protein
MLDMRALILGQTISYAACMGLVALLWHQNRRRFPGLGFWLAGFVMQTIASVLLILRGIIPLWVSAVGANALIWGGTILLYIGLERFVERRSRQVHNGVLWVLLLAVHSIFVFVQPSLAARNVNTSVGLLLISLQIAWLTLRRVETEKRRMTGLIGFVFVGFALVSVARIVVNVALPPGNDFFAATGPFDALLILTYQILVLAVTFSLFLMINRRLFLELEIQQTALQRSEAQYRQLVELSPEALFVYRDGMIDFVNPAAVSLLGAARTDDLVGRNIFEFLHPDYQTVARKRIAGVLAQGEPAPLLEQKFVRFDGTVIDVEVTTARFEYQGQTALQTIARDITERKQTEAILQLRLRLMEFATRHPLDALMQKALDEIGLLTHSPIGFYHFVEADQKTLSLQAWSTRTTQEFCQAEGKGMHYSIDEAGVWVDCVHQRKPVIHNDYAALPHRKGLPPGHAEVKRELVVPTMRDERIVAILGVGNKPVEYDEQDVTLVAYVADVIWSIVERKRAEEQLEAYQSQLEAQNTELRKLTLAVEQSGSAVVITDTSGDIEYVNPRFEEMTGYAPSEVWGKNPRILKSGRQSAEYYQVLWETITSSQIWRGEFHNKRKDGTLYWELATIAPVLDPAGQITHYIAIKDDITARKEAEEELQHYAEQLALQNAELDAFAHTVAHDLKSPVGIVVGYANLLEQEYADLSPDERQESVRVIARFSEKLNTIIDELLLLAGVRKEEVSFTPLPMAEIVQEAYGRLEKVIEEAQAHITEPEPSAWPAAIGYAPWVEEVWANYISNAIKYGGDPPRIEIGWDGPAEGAPIPFISFWVRDNGPGLTPEAQSKLFTPFTRLGQVRVQGHGLGLSIVQRIVEKLGGEVGVESAPGQGSRFFFTLPAADGAMAQPSALDSHSQIGSIAEIEAI